MTVNVDDVVAAYMKLRKAKDDLEKSIEEQVKVIEAKMTKMESWIKEQADAQGVTSFKTKHGTAFLSTTDYATVADWILYWRSSKNKVRLKCSTRQSTRLPCVSTFKQTRSCPPV